MLKSAAALAAAVLAVAGCGGDEPPLTATPTPAAAVPAPADVAADCREYVPRAATAPPPSLLQPPGEIAVRRAGTGGIARVAGYVDMTPGAFLAAWRTRPDVTVLYGEDEGFEAEVHLQAAGTQVFWQLKKVCDTGSTFTAVVTTAG